MRHQYTPIFRDLLTSSLWITDPATRCVWVWMLLSADPEGFVCATIPGLAQAANVSLEQAKAAIVILEGEDEFSATRDLEGRRLVKVERGWHIVNFVAWRERAKEEAEKARKRAWAKKHRDAQKQLPLPGYELPPSPLPYDAEDHFLATGERLPEPSVAERSETVDAPKPKPIPKPKEERSGSPPPPVVPLGLLETHRELNGIFAAELLPRVVRKLSEVTLSEPLLAALRAEAQLAGLTPAEFDQRLKDLGTGPIGGVRGVLSDEVPNYIRAQLPKWRLWAETDRSKAQREAAAPPSRRFGPPEAPPEPPRPRVAGMPDWVYAEHAEFATEHGLDLKRAARVFAKQSHINPSNMRPVDVCAPFRQFLENLAREKESAA